MLDPFKNLPALDQPGFGFGKIAVRKNYYRDNREDALVLALPLGPAAERRLG